MTNEAIKALMIFALYGILEVILCAPSVHRLKTVLSTRAVRGNAPDRVTTRQRS